MSSSRGNNDEPSTAPPPDRWYPLTLGSSFKDDHSSSSSKSKFCTLRYEFKPASIDKTQPGTLHKNNDNRVTVEFQNNQPGKPKVTFEGSSEDYKENDAVLFFDGQHFRLERLHRSFKRLRHIRLPGESNAAASASASADASSPPVARGASKHHNLAKATFNPAPVEVERIDIGKSGNSDAHIPDVEKAAEVPPPNPIPSFASPDDKNDDLELDLEEQLDIVDDDDSPQREVITGIDINNLPHQMDTDDEIADVDVNEDDLNTGCNAAEALRAQVNAEGKEGQTSSSSESSGSSSSDSGSSSSDSESSDGNTVDSI